MEDNKQEIIQEKFCICCGRPQSMVPLLLEGNFGNICSDCVNQAFNTVREQNEKVSKNLMSGIPKPHEIKKFLDNTKVYVNGKSEEIQKKLFSFGYYWYGTNYNKVQFTKEPFLFISDLGGSALYQFTPM